MTVRALIEELEQLEREHGPDPITAGAFCMDTDVAYDIVSVLLEDYGRGHVRAMLAVG